MRTCPRCGRITSDPAATVCFACGAALGESAPPVSLAVSPTPEAAGAGIPAAPSQPMYPPPGYPPYPPYPPYPAAPSQPMYPYGWNPQQPAAPSQPMYPYGVYPPGTMPPAGMGPAPYSQAPGANWRPAQKRGNSALVIALVITLVVAVLGGVGFGVYELAVKSGAPVTLAGATATATTPDNALLNDPLANNDNEWPTDTSHHCYFSNDGYHVANNETQSGYYNWYCGAPMGAIADGSVSVTVAEVSGTTLQPYGIAFRFNKSGTTSIAYYWFAIDANSKWALFRDVNDKFTRIQDYTYSSAIHGGLNDKNTLTVEFRGQNITCKVNGVTMGVITDQGSSLGSGYVVLQVGNNVNAVFTNFLALP